MVLTFFVGVNVSHDVVLILLVGGVLSEEGISAAAAHLVGVEVLLLLIGVVVVVVMVMVVSVMVVVSLCLLMWFVEGLVSCSCSVVVLVASGVEAVVGMSGTG